MMAWSSFFDGGTTGMATGNDADPAGFRFGRATATARQNDEAGTYMGRAVRLSDNRVHAD